MRRSRTDHPRPRRGLPAALLLLAACGPGRPAPEAPAPGAEPTAPALPPIPERRGPLSLDVAYPVEGGLIAVRDSTFAYGSTGTGEARLRINGAPVGVEPNGTFLAFLPVPADGVYRFVATTAADTAVVERTVRTPPPTPVLGPDSAVILRDTIEPAGAWSALPMERIAVRFRGTPSGRASLILPDGERVPLLEFPVVLEPDPGQRAFGTDTARLTEEVVRGVSEYRGEFTARPLRAADGDVGRPILAPPPPPVHPTGDRDADDPADAGGPAIVELVVGIDTARVPLPLSLAILDPDRLPVGETVDPGAFGDAGDGIVVGRPAPGYTYLYFWPDGTRLTLDGERDGEFRVRLAPDLSAWVAAGEVRLLPPATPPPGGRIGTVRFSPGPESVDVRVELDDRLPFLVDEGERSITLILYGGTPDTDWLQYGGVDDFIEWAEWRQPRDEVYELVLHLARRPWGYQTLWAENGDLLLRVRRPPEIDPDRPLRGLLIAVDPGHPPAGAYGPTGFTEAQANLAIALRLRPLLEAAGARVLMTRTDQTAVPLQARTTSVVAAGADLLVSIHNNAFPDGVNPFENHGTSVYYFHRHSVDLARSLQRELLRELRLRDLGIGRANLALVRPTWMPAALTETMYLMVPRQEAALRDPAVQERIARAHRDAIEAFLRGRAREP